MCETLFAGLTHREPILDETDFEKFVETVTPLLKPNRDVLWVLAGRTDSNVSKIKKCLRKHNFKLNVFYLCYNTKQMHQYGYWKMQRGIANSKNLEAAIYAYKGKQPQSMPKARLYVDEGSLLFNEVVRNVPVLAPKYQALVPKAVREKSLETMVGVPGDDGGDDNAQDPGDVETQPSAAELEELANKQAKALVDAQMNKRKLYRQTTGTNVPWFPHDNDIELLKELCWEAGRPRWVLFGTPAGGAGIHGCLESGASVVALCYDEHHRKHLQQFFLERAVEALASGKSAVFKDEDLLARSIEMKVCQTPKAASATAEPKAKEKSDKEAPAEEKPKKDKPKSNKGKEKPRRQKPKTKAVEPSSDEEDPSDEDSSDEEPLPKKQKKG